MRTLVRRTLGVVAVASSVAGAFAAGAVAGGDGPATAGSAVAAGSTVAAGSPATGGGTLDEVAARIESQALHPVGRRALDAAAVAAMLRAAGDQWGTWSTGATPAPSSAGYAGVGLWLRTAGHDALLVAQVTPGSPAAYAGLRPGDELRSVGGRAAAGLGAPAVAAALRGRAGSQVSVVVRRAGAVRTVRLVRAEVPAVGVAVALRPVAGGPAVGSITVPSVTRGVGRSVREGVGRLRRQQATGIVLDLRGNPGGLLDEAVETASAFLGGGRVVTYVRRDGHAQRLDAVGRGDTATPLVVLVDGGTASAAEVVAGALQDRGRAVLVGSRTFGKGTVQEPGRLSDGSRLELTVARYSTPAGRSLEGVGLEPDIEVSAGSAPEVAMRRGVEVLSGLVADTAASAGGRG